MKNKKLMVIGIILVILIGVLSAVFMYTNSAKKGDKIPDGYVAVFHGGSGELTYSTYIYKIDNGHDNYGFKYINTENHTKFWGSSEWIVKIVDKGEFDWTDGAFIIAEKHGAYSYVVEPGSDKIYTIEEYQSMFIMN